MSALSWENAAWLWGWVWWGISGCWPVFVALPGLVAFHWQRQDRKAKRLAQTPYFKIESDKRLGKAFDWQFMRIYVRNDSAAPIELRTISVDDKGVILAKKRDNNSPDIGSADRSIQLSLYVSRGGENETYAFVGSTLRSMSQVQLSMRAQYEEMSAARRKSNPKITSEPIDVPHITISKNS